jgi:hypothetical protein
VICWTLIHLRTWCRVLLVELEAIAESWIRACTASASMTMPLELLMISIEASVS